MQYISAAQDFPILFGFTILQFIHREAYRIRISHLIPRIPTKMAPLKTRKGKDVVDDHDAPTPIVRDRNISQDTAPMLETPMKSRNMEFIEASGSLTRRMTRSMTQAQPNPAIDSTPGGTTRLQDRLRTASSKNGKNIGSSNLEESRSITYIGRNRGERNLEEDNEEEEGEEGATIVAQRSVARSLPSKERYSKKGLGPASRRTSSRKKLGKTATRDSTPSDTIASTRKDGYRLRKRRKLDISPSRVPLRRSARLSKPLTVFHSYPNLPVELQMMIWEAAITPRLVYLRNVFSIPYAGLPTAQNEIPPWFLACRLSLKVALQHYQNMFPFISPQPMQQPVNPNVDTIVFEPCCNGCRAKHCASRQFSEYDRALVRRIAVQTESPYLMPTAQPCWESIAETWPNVDTIYLMQTAIKGHDTQEKVMIRLQEGHHETSLRKKFDNWKKSSGKDKSVECIEFVTVVHKQGDDVPPKDRYRSILDRKTNGPEDIIVG